MTTYAQLQTLVSGNVIDLPTAVVANVPAYINQALETLQNAHRFKVMEVLGGPYTTTAGSHTLVAAPTRFKEPRGDAWFLTQLGRKSPILWSERGGAIEAFGEGTVDRGRPQLLVDGEMDEAGVRNFLVYPFPDGASDWGGGEYRVYIPYWRYVTPLSAAGDTNWFTQQTAAVEWIERQATANAFFADWDETRGTLWQQRAGEKLAEIVREDKRYRLSAVSTLVPLYQGGNSPRVRF